jgi:hypothetical protein
MTATKKLFQLGRCSFAVVLPKKMCNKFGWNTKTEIEIIEESFASVTTGEPIYYLKIVKVK